MSTQLGRIDGIIAQKLEEKICRVKKAEQIIDEVGKRLSAFCAEYVMAITATDICLDRDKQASMNTLMSVPCDLCGKKYVFFGKREFSVKFRMVIGRTGNTECQSWTGEHDVYGWRSFNKTYCLQIEKMLHATLDDEMDMLVNNMHWRTFTGHTATNVDSD